jgi:hypothetical protein
VGAAKRKHWVRHDRRNPGRVMPPEVWNVVGTDQHGGPLNFDETECRAALEHADRINRLGGCVVVRRMVWNGPAAAYRVPQQG